MKTEWYYHVCSNKFYIYTITQTCLKKILMFMFLYLNTIFRFLSNFSLEYFLMCANWDWLVWHKLYLVHTNKLQFMWYCHQSHGRLFGKVIPFGKVTFGFFWSVSKQHTIVVLFKETNGNGYSMLNTSKCDHILMAWCRLSSFMEQQVWV